MARNRLLKPLLEAAEAPLEAQSRALLRIAQRNAATTFGRRHGFDRIRTLADLRAAMPIHGFEDLRPWVERQADTGEACLTSEPPVMYNLTSGTTAKPKLVPVTASGIARIKREQRIFAAALYEKYRGVFSGRVVGIGSPAVEGCLPNGAPFGSVTGVIYREMPAAIRGRYLLPPDVFDIPDYDLRYRVIATYLLAADDVTVASTANPSTFLRLLGVIRESLEIILADLASGALPRDLGLPAASRTALLAALPAAQGRVRELARLAERGPLDYATIWPRLRAVATWTGGSCGIALEALRAVIPKDAQIVEVGYAASEFRGSINVTASENFCLPTLTELVFEFIDVSEQGSDRPRTLGLHEIDVGGRYKVIATTPDGLYRYDINDIVEAVGRIGRTPAIRFVQKGRGVTNITGEKLYESQVSAALQSVCTEAGLRPLFYLALADERAARYRLYVEMDGPVDRPTALARQFDVALSERNNEYRSKRASGRLEAPSVTLLARGASDAYRHHCVAQGQRESQFKVMPLRYAREVDFDVDAWCVDHTILQ